MSIIADISSPICGTSFQLDVRVDFASAYDASVPIQAPPTSPGALLRRGATAHRCVSAFYLSPPSVSAVEAGGWVGSVEKGSSVNCDNLVFCPHGAGTHSECVGHIMPAGPTIASLLPSSVPPVSLALLLSPVPCTLSSIPSDALLLPYPAAAAGDSVVNAAAIISAVEAALAPTVAALDETTRAALVAAGTTRAAALRSAAATPSTGVLEGDANSKEQETLITLAAAAPDVVQAVVSGVSPAALTLAAAAGRTVVLRSGCLRAHAQEQGQGQLTADFNGKNPPYLTACAVAALHLLCSPIPSASLDGPSVCPSSLVVDLPSLDRSDDQGNLTAHHAFFRSSWFARARTAAAAKAEAEAGAGASEQVKRAPCSEEELARLKAAAAVATEFAWLPSQGQPECMDDGVIAVSLQVPAVESDAAPSRPLLLAPRRARVVPTVTSSRGSQSLGGKEDA